MNERMKVSDWSQPYKLAIGVIVVLLLGFFVFNDKPKMFGSEIPMTVTGTNSSSTVGTVAKQVFTANDSIQYRSISNPGPQPVYISKTATSTGFGAGIGQIIYASTTYEMSGESLWRGNIWAITAGATSTLTTSQL